VFGWFNVVMEPGAYTAFELGLLLVVIGLCGWVSSRVVQRRWRELTRVGLLALWSAAFIVALVGWTQARYPQGRLLFPAMPAIAILLVIGLAQWLPERWAGFVVPGLMVALLCFAAIVPFRYIAPAYAPTQSLTAAEHGAITYPLSVGFGDRMRLIGYDVSGEMIKPGERLWVSLYWECLAPMNQDYSVFVHLVDVRGVTVAQRDSYPGSGNNPTRDWEVGQSMRDVHPLDVPETLLARAPFRVRVGLYEYSTRRRLPIDGSPIGSDALDLPLELGLEGRANGLYELRTEFGECIALTGYAVEPLAAQPGETLKVTLRWRALRALNEDYTVFVHLMREDAQIWGQDDHVPKQGQSRTSTWVAGQVVLEEFDLQVSPDAPEDSYELVVGLYDSATITRLGMPNGLDFVVLGKVDIKRK